MRSGLVDGFGRAITYLRVSVTDRCNLRCGYCMAGEVSFSPHRDVLTIEELEFITSAFVACGVRKVRITGGEPLVRKGVMHLFEGLSRHLRSGDLDELCVTTNGTLLSKYARDLAACGVRRLNVSLDTLDRDRFAEITSGGHLDAVLKGIDAARDAGLAIKLNTVAQKGYIEGDADALVQFAQDRQLDITFIETMPLGEVKSNCADHYLPLGELRRIIERRWTLTDTDEVTGGPARYARIEETGGRIGFITALSNCFCENCNRLRLSATGSLYTCLGHDDSTDLRSIVREQGGMARLEEAIRCAVAAKPKSHEFGTSPGHEPALKRQMSVLGG
ncbi:GTP 3',8-cyclase MoaA [Pleomorphomonas oryzae]|uniref:GTP 3',8-cyclase MoaA n=1 Tax=Pleomorphomonas oryzae TaxID=261934 RepID=UPI00047C2786|nr:GTP 3',8-cyclase MoaA [Pleomorphomonas oryzae]